MKQSIKWYEKNLTNNIANIQRELKTVDSITDRLKNSEKECLYLAIQIAIAAKDKKESFDQERYLNKPRIFAILEYFDYLTSEIGDLRTKSWLKVAIISHTGTRFKMRNDHISIILDIWWNENFNLTKQLETIRI